MAPRKKKVTTKIVTVSKEEKAARAGIIRSTQMAVAQNAARVGTATRGATTGPRLRQAGGNLSSYDMGKYTDTTKNVTTSVPTGGDGKRPSGGGGGTRKRSGPTEAQKAAARRKKVMDKAAADYRRVAARNAAAKRKKAQEVARKARIRYLQEKAKKARTSKRVLEQGGGGTGRAT